MFVFRIWSDFIWENLNLPTRDSLKISEELDFDVFETGLNSHAGLKTVNGVTLNIIHNRLDYFINFFFSLITL